MDVGISRIIGWIVPNSCFPAVQENLNLLDQDGGGIKFCKRIRVDSICTGFLDPETVEFQARHVVKRFMVGGEGRF